MWARQRASMTRGLEMHGEDVLQACDEPMCASCQAGMCMSCADVPCMSIVMPCASIERAV